MTLRLFARAAALSALVGATLVAAPGPTLAVTTPTFDITVGNCWRGKVPDQYAQVHVVWKDSTGHLVDSFDTESQEYGYWSFLESDTTCSTRPIRPGDQLTETETDMGMYSRSFVVRALTGTFDRKSNLVRGNAPKSSSMYMSVFPEDLIGHYAPPPCNDVIVDTAANGSFVYDTAGCQTGYNATGGDTAWFTWFSPKGDRETLVLTAPYARLRFGSSQVSGSAFAGASVSVALTSSTGAVRATGKTNADVNGNWTLLLRNSRGNPVKAHVGDVVSGNWATGNSAFTVFAMTTGFGTNSVHGTCTPNTRYSLIVLWAGTPYYSTHAGMTNSGGATGDFTPDNHTIASGDQILFTCAKPNGDRERQITVDP